MDSNKRQGAALLLWMWLWTFSVLS